MFCIGVRGLVKCENSTFSRFLLQFFKTYMDININVKSIAVMFGLLFSKLTLLFKV